MTAAIFIADSAFSWNLRDQLPMSPLFMPVPCDVPFYCWLRGLAGDIVFRVHPNRRAGKILWLALVAGSCFGGWFSGKAFVNNGNGAAEARIQGKRHERSSAADFAAGTPRGSWMEKVRKAGPGNMPLLLAEAGKLFPEGADGYGPVEENALRWFFAMWMAKDRNGFLEVIIDPEFHHSYWAAQALVAVDPEWAAELLRGGLRGRMDEFFVGQIASELAEKSPAVYLTLNPDGKFKAAEYHGDDWETAITSLAKTDALAAANAWLGWKMENAPRSLCATFLAIAESWKAGDGSLAGWVDGIKDTKIRNLAHHMRISAMAKEDPHAALAELYRAKLEDDNDIDRDAPREVLARLAEADPLAALKLMEDLESMFSKSGEYQIPDPFAEETPGGSSNPFRSLGPGIFGGGGGVENNGVRYVVLQHLAKSLPDDPARFWDKLHGYRTAMGDGQSDWQRGVEAGLIRVKSEGWSADVCLQVAIRWAAETGGKGDDATFRELAKRAASLNPGAVMNALDQLPEASRGQFAAEAIKRLPDTHAEQRVALLDKVPAEQWDEELAKSLGRNGADYAPVIASLPVQRTLVARRAFASGWGDGDPEAAAAWTQSLPDDAGAAASAAGLAETWASYDEYAASAWAASLPAGQMRDGAAASLAESFSRRDPESAWQWAASVSDLETRAEALTSVVYRWRHDTPAALRVEMTEARLAAGLPDRNFMFGGSNDTSIGEDPFAEDNTDPFAE